MLVRLEGEKITWDLRGANNADQRKFLRKMYEGKPRRFQLALAEKFKDDLERDGLFTANTNIRLTNDGIKECGIQLNAPDDLLIKIAETEARETLKLLWMKDSAIIQARRWDMEVSGYGWPSSFDLLSDSGIVARLKDPVWWRRVVRRKYGRALEVVALSLNLVNGKKGKYCSDETLARYIEQVVRNRDLMENMEVINEKTGEVWILLDISDKTTSNPKLRRNEQMVQAAGYEAVAKALGHVPYFLTWTAPSRFHSSLSGSCLPNPKFDGSTPKEAQRYFTNLFEMVRAKLARRGIRCYGCRVVEPHHDGCPHWHLLVFVEPEHEAEMLEVFRSYAMRESPDESGAAKHRFKAVKIDWSKGTAVGYIAKYISKSIDGFGLAENEKSESRRVVAWASTWGIRQFQFFGGPNIGIWRELRRIKSSDGLPADLLPAWEAADNGDYAAFIKTMGGVRIAKKDRPVQLLKEYADREGRYGEPVGNVVVGLECAGGQVRTRGQQWVIQPRVGRIPAPWSPVNNCTLPGLLAGIDNLKPVEDRPIFSRVDVHGYKIGEFSKCMSG